MSSEENLTSQNTPIPEEVRKEIVLMLSRGVGKKEIRDMADFVGSTSQILEFVKETTAKKVIVGTEEGVIHQLKKERPDIEFILAYSEFVCDQMKMTTVDRLLKALEREQFEVEVPEEIAERARVAIEKMLEIS